MHSFSHICHVQCATMCEMYDGGVAQLARCLYYYSRLIQASIIWFIIFPFSFHVYRVLCLYVYIYKFGLLNMHNVKQCQLLQMHKHIVKTMEIEKKTPITIIISNNNLCFGFCQFQ